MFLQWVLGCCRVVEKMFIGCSFGVLGRVILSLMYSTWNINFPYTMLFCVVAKVLLSGSFSSLRCCLLVHSQLYLKIWCLCKSTGFWIKKSGLFQTFVCSRTTYNACDDKPNVRRLASLWLA